MKGLRKLFKWGKEQDLEQDEEKRTAEHKLENVRDKIYPYFKQFKAITEESVPLPDNLSEIDNAKIYEAPQVQLVRRTIVEGLELLYAVDSGYSYEIIQERNLAEWHLTEDQLYEIAKENFNNLLVNNLKGHGDSNALMLTVNGNLEAGLVLIDPIWEQLEPQIDDTLVIAVPSRDVVLVTGEHKKEFLSSLRQKAREIYEKGDHPISELLYRRVNGKWEVFEKF
ncbi:MAG: DUF1444 family protein [Chitinophagaceae bacterium]|nr:DUF1444 family protein [Chitinophagaceae bacterium]